MEGKYYLVYRVYKGDEVKFTKQNSRIYGWTNSKAVLQAFMQQRDEKKYLSFKMEEEEFLFRTKQIDEDLDKLRIDFLRLKSVQEDGEFKLFITENEAAECEKKIQRLLTEYSSISKMEFKSPNKEILYFVNLYLNLKKSFRDALFFLGHRPPEIEDLFDSVEETGTYTNENDIANKIIYSLEAYIKVLREDL